MSEVIDNEMLDKMKDLFRNEESNHDVEEREPLPPLEEAIERALFTLSEIAIFGSYGRSAECVREANSAIKVLTELKAKYDEQNKIIDILSRQESDIPTGYA